MLYMKNMPWGPHGQEAPPNTVRQNPTAPDAPQQIGGYGDVAVPMSGGGGGLGAILANIIFSLVLVALLWIPMICLYPLTALAGLTTGFGTFQVLRRVLPPDGGDVAALGGVVAGAVVVLIVNRFEYRLAQQPAFRRIRHLLRMVLLAVWAIPIIQLSTGTTGPSTSTRYILAVMSSPRAWGSFLARPANVALWIAVVIGLHMLIWWSDRARTFWHRRLKFVGLK